MITFKNVTLGYAGKNILSGLNFSIPDSTICLISGANGSGKSTLAKGILRLISPASGEIVSPYKKLGYAPQTFSLNLNYPITLFDLLRGGYKPRNLFETVFARVKSKTDRQKKEDSVKIQKLISLFELEVASHLLLREASAGQLQKTLIARALVNDPELLILDEPFANLDDRSLNQIIKILQKKNREINSTICIIDHHTLYKMKDEYTTVYQHEIRVADGSASLDT